MRCSLRLIALNGTDEAGAVYDADSFPIVNDGDNPVPFDAQTHQTV
jgi:hypothetical protein